jgi:flagellar biosynthesis regulator FlbT
MIPTSIDMLNGTYLLSFFILGSFIVWPEETTAVLTATSLKIQIYWINWRMKRQAYQMYRQIVKLSKEAGFPHPGEFRFTNIWDREPLD